MTSHLSRIHGFYTNNSHRFSLDMRGFKYPKSRKRRKYSPSNEDVRKLNSFADTARMHLIITIAYQNGALPVDIAGLRIGDYPTEAWIYFEKSRSKTGEVWCGISTPDACNYLKAYMIQRGGAKGEPLFLGYGDQPILAQTISELIHDLIEKAGLSDIEGFIPKCLRDGFEDALIDARTYHKVKEALMGHTSGISHKYGSAEKREKRLIEAMQKAYTLLCLTDFQANPAALAGFSPEDVTEIKEWVKHKAEWRALLQLAKQGDLVNINDPELPRKLKDKGVNS